MKLHLVSYDIPGTKKGNRRRRKLVRLLEEFGDRVQYSVFELRLSGRDDHEELRERLTEIIDESEDQLRIYPISSQEEKNIAILGEGEVYTVEEAYFF